MSSFSVFPVVLCGGSGTRLWPRSRASKPKPFLPLVSDTTLFEATVLRGGGEEHFEAPVVVTGRAHLDHVQDQLSETDDVQVVVEPCARNTAAAIALAALRLPRDAVMLVCPSDHHIADPDAFRQAAVKAADLARDGWLVSFGIEAKSPETGFGYLERGEPIGTLGFRTRRFVEKPDPARARAFVDSGDYAWNGGIFAFQVSTFIDELKHHRPELLSLVEDAVRDGEAEGRLFHPAAAPFAAIASESVDYAVMENTDRAAMVPADMGWSDIGSWDAVKQVLPADADGNSVRGRAELVDCRNILVDSDGPRVSVIGLEGVAVIVDGDEVLVTTLDKAQKVGKLDGAVRQ